MISTYIIAFLIAAAVSYGLTPVVRKMSLSRGWVDRPSSRKMNKKPMPTIGGLAIYLGFVAAILFLMFKEPFSQETGKFLGVLAGGLIVVLIGIQDDIRGLAPRRKLFYQISAAMIASAFGYVIFKARTPLGETMHMPALISMGVTIFWIVGITNAVNLLDGLDGLAAGIVAIIAGSLFFAAAKDGNPITAIFAIALMGSCLGFLPHNFYPAKIFMGDTGSMFLGISLALISIEGAQKSSTLITLLIPIIAMGVPVMDTGLSILRRLVKGGDVFKADKEHIHHKLVFINGSQREAVLRLYFLTICFGVIAISLTGIKGVWAFIGLVVTAMLTLRWIVNHGFLDFVDEGRKEAKSVRH